MIFVNSMSDLFHKGVPNTFVDRVFATVERANWHTFQILTKRSSRLRDYMNNRYANRTPPRHLWVGASVEDGRRASRIRHMRDTKGAIRFLSIEPMIGPLGRIDLSESSTLFAERSATSTLSAVFFFDVVSRVAVGVVVVNKWVIRKFRMPRTGLSH